MTSPEFDSVVNWKYSEVSEGNQQATKSSCLLLWLVTFSILELQWLTSFHADNKQQLAKKNLLINCESSLVINHIHDWCTASFYKQVTKFQTVFLKAYGCCHTAADMRYASAFLCLRKGVWMRAVTWGGWGGWDVFRGPSICPTAMTST